MLPSLGKRLRDVRERKKLTQIEVYKRTGINNKTLSGYENEVSEPDLESLKVLADLYEVSTDYLLGRVKEKDEITSQEPSLDEIERMNIAAHMENEYGEHDPEFTRFIQRIIGQVREEYDLVQKKKTEEREK